MRLTTRPLFPTLAMRPTVLLPALVALACAPVLAQAPGGMPAMAPPPPQIVTGGHGEVRLTPDKATLLVSVQTRAATAAAAGADNARRVKATLDTLRAIGLTSDQLATVGYSVTAVQQYDSKTGPKVVGYDAQNTVRVELRRLDQVGRVIDAALAAGANNIASIQFTASGLDSARRTALAAAVSQARADADAMAKAAGGALGPLIEISAEPQQPPPGPMMYARATLAQAAPETPINPGDFIVSATVSARWQFVPAPAGR
jgi:uncharacterized protein YggE